MKAAACTERYLWLFIRIPGGGRGPGPARAAAAARSAGQPETVIWADAPMNCAAGGNG
jgi:hypothetical protein